MFKLKLCPLANGVSNLSISKFYYSIFIQPVGQKDRHINIVIDPTLAPLLLFEIDTLAIISSIPNKISSFIYSHYLPNIPILLFHRHLNIQVYTNED